MNRRDVLRMLAAITAAPRATGADTADDWNAGAASVDITPEQSLWMAGFARRTRPSQGVALPLHAKALALRHGRGQPVGARDRRSAGGHGPDHRPGRIGGAAPCTGSARADILFNASHTHCGPVVDEQLSVAYDLTAAQWDDIRAYTAQLEDRLVALVGQALVPR